MFSNRARLSWIPTPVFSCVLLLALCLASGCGSANNSNSSVSGATVAPRRADLPACSASTPTPSSTNISARYHLVSGATDRDRLFFAILKDDKEGLSALLSAGADIHSTRGRNSYTITQDGQVSFADDVHDEPVSLLHWASAMSVSGDTIRVLLKKGADVGAKDSKGVTPLMEASKNPYLAPSGFSALLSAGANVHDRDHDQKDALLHAVSIDNTDHGVLCLMSAKVQTLLAAGSDIDENVTYTPVMTALMSRNLGMAKLAFALGGDLRARATLDGGTALHAVARAQDDSLETVHWLLSRGIDLRVRDNLHKTALALFKENLSEGRCHTVDAARPQTNLCAAGTEAIIKAIEQHHRR